MRRKPFGKRDSTRKKSLAGKWLWALVLIGCACMTISPRPAYGQGTEVAIVVNAQTPVDNLTLAEVRKLFLGDRQFWTSNLRVVLLVRAPVAQERNTVLRSIYEMSEAQFRQYWIAKIFRDQTTSGPKIVYSAEMTNELIAAIPGSIAFMQADKVQPGTKVLRINGKLPGERGYPLQ